MPARWPDPAIQTFPTPSHYCPRSQWLAGKKRIYFFMQLIFVTYRQRLDSSSLCPNNNRDPPDNGMNKHLVGLIAVVALITMSGAGFAGSQTLPASVCNTENKNDKYKVDESGRFIVQNQGGATVHCPIVREKSTGSKIKALEVYVAKINKLPATCRVRTMVGGVTRHRPRPEARATDRPEGLRYPILPTASGSQTSRCQSRAPYTSNVTSPTSTSWSQSTGPSDTTV